MSERKSLFDKNDKYGVDANCINGEVCNAVLVVIRKYAAMGYSYREIAGIAHGAVVEAECSFGLDRDWDRNKG
jgi:hypothetical protein